MKRIKKIKPNIAVILAFTFLFSLGYPRYNLKAINLEPMVNYSGYIQNNGWEPTVFEGDLSGTEGKALQLQGIVINLENAPAGAKIKYSAHIQNVGWTNYVYGNTILGYLGKYRIEALKIAIEGFASNYHVEYQTHIQNLGWSTWSRDGAISGTTGQSLRIEALRIRIVNDNTTASVQYASHVQNLGWLNPVNNGSLSGTSGKALRLEAFKTRLINAPSNMGITYSGYISGAGWQNSVSDYVTAGTIGLARPIEAIKISLTNPPSGYHVQYSIHVQDYGWTPFSVDGDISGYPGSGKRVEAIRIKLFNTGNSQSSIYNVPSGSNITFTNPSYSLASFANRELTETTNKISNSPANYSQIYDALNPASFTDLTKTAQFLVLDKFNDCISVSSLNSYLANKGAFAGQADAFINAARDYNINVLGLVAHSMLETGNGTSSLSKGVLVSSVNGNPVTPKVVYNFYGIGAIDSGATVYGAEAAYVNGWTTPAAAIRGGAAWIASGYIHSTRTGQKQSTFYEMKWNYSVIWHQYATDINWPSSISKKVAELYPYCSNTSFDFRIPKY